MSAIGTIDIRQAIEAQAGSRYATIILVACAATMIVEGYDAQVVAYAAPAMIRAWHIDRAAFGPVFGAALFGYMLGATVLSGLSDRFGRKRVIAAGNLCFGALTIASAFATTIPELLSLRFVAGLGLGCSIPAAIALAVEYSPEGRRAFRVSLLFVGYTIGAAAGGLLAAALMSQFGWQSAFLLGGALSLAVGAASLAVLPESARFLAARGTDARRIAAILRRLRPDLAVTDTTRFVLVEDKPEPGLPVAQLFANGRAWLTVLLWVAFVSSLGSHYFLTSWLPTVLDASGIPLTHAVAAGALIQAGGAFGSLGVGRLMDRLGVIAVVGSFLLAVPLIVLIGAAPVSEPVLMAIVFLAGLFLLGGQVGLNALASTIYPTAIRSSGAGWALGVGRLGSILGPLIGGVLIGAGLSSTALFACAAVPALLSAAALLALRQRLPSRAPAPAQRASLHPEAIS